MIPEAELLLCCARKDLEAESRNRIESLLNVDLRWDLLLRIASRHGMRPLLHRHLRNWEGRVPQPVMQSLNTHFQYHSLRNLALTRELLNLLNLLEQHGVEAVPFKGPVLAQIGYKDLSLREFADLDLLVRKPDARRVRDLLASAGYRSSGSLSDDDPFLRTQSVFPMSKESFQVDLHWEFLEHFFPFPLQVDSVWPRLQRIQLGGQTVQTLSPEDLMLVLSAHNAKHLWERIGWVCDVAELIRQRPWNEDVLVSRAKSIGCRRMLALAFLLARDLTGAPLPAQIESEIRQDPALLRLAAEVTAGLTSEADQKPRIVEEPLFRSRYLPLWERKRDRFRYCMRALFTPTIEDRKVFRLPRILFPLYFALRPFRLLARYLQKGS